MTNAFTAKPDLTKFIKQLNHSQNTAKLGRRASEKPTIEQRAYFSHNVEPSKRSTKTSI